MSLKAQGNWRIKNLERKTDFRGAKTEIVIRNWSQRTRKDVLNWDRTYQSKSKMESRI